MDERLLEKVRDYFSGAMSMEERQLFESEVNTNDELAAIVDLYQTIETGIPDTGQDTQEEALLRQTLKNLHDQCFPGEPGQGASSSNAENGVPSISLVSPGPEALPEDGIKEHKATRGLVRRMNVWKRLSIAAIAIGVIVTGGLLFLPRNNESGPITAGNDHTKEPPHASLPDTPAPQPDASVAKEKNRTRKTESSQPVQSPVLDKAERDALYASNFKPDALPPGYSHLLEEALSHYKNGDYRDAIAAIDVNAIEASIEELRPRGMPDEQQETEDAATLFYAHYFKGLSYMAVAETEEAIVELRDALSKSPDRAARSKVQWYLALTYLKTGRLAEAKKQLQQVVRTAPAGTYQQQARSLLRQLETGG